MTESGVPNALREKPRILRMSDTDLTLSWHPSIPYRPQSPVTYNLEWCKQPSNDWTSYKTRKLIQLNELKF